MTGDFSYSHYLEAKRSVDDRAINRPVLKVVRDCLRAARTRPRVLELGGGTGSMVRRCLEWGLLPAAHYTLVDESAEAIESLPAMLQAWATQAANTRLDKVSRTELVIEREDGRLALHLVQGELSAHLQESDEPYDLVIANAVLDLVDLGKVLPQLWKRMSPGALFWFTINFDGESVFLPALSDDEKIFEAYHASMDRRTGSRHTGRALFAALRDTGASILESGSSDWVVHAIQGEYRADEAYFLQHIVHTINQELRDHPDLEATAFQEWIAARHQHIDDGELVYIAHQLDFVGLSAGAE